MTIRPFCTSGSSGIGRSAESLEALTDGGTWLEERRFPSDVRDEELQAWIDEAA